MNNAVMNTVCKYLLEALLSILWGMYPEVGLLSGVEILLFYSLGDHHTVSTVAVTASVSLLSSNQNK